MAISVGVGLLVAAGVSLLGNLIGGGINASENAANRREARRLDDRNFAYQQQRDRIGDAQKDRQFTMGVVQGQVDQVNNMLRTNIGLRDRMISLWGGGR
jgi:hypothetical protein